MALKKKRKPPYANILRKPLKKLRGGQEVPMDLDKINAALEQARLSSPKE